MPVTTAAPCDNRAGRTGVFPATGVPRPAVYALTSIFVPAYVSSPELTFGFLFALEDPQRIADVVRDLMERRAVSVFRLARLSDDDGPPERFVVNWSSIPQINITTAAPGEDELRDLGILLVNAFLSERGEVSMYAAHGNTAG
ncbi:hypothetical protein ACFYTF_10735 [Nocardia thailandica]|uniref:Uncharacterized protein n=1 Tax=Nocardia thailandica TaxID=257275 RepID=A0ABW6PLY0_9NOCA